MSFFLRRFGGRCSPPRGNLAAVPREPREEMDALLDAVLKLATRHIEEHGEFYPFGASIDRDGTLAMAAASPGEEFPESSQLIAMLTEGFSERANRSEIRASAICCDVRLQPDTGYGDGIRATIEHASADPVEVVLPYSRGEGGTEYGDLRASRAASVIFRR